MVSPNIRDFLTSFNPSSDLFVIASIDGRIKIWDAMKGHLHTELFNLAPSPNSPAILAGGHLSLDYTCMKWLHLGSKKKKIWSSVLVLGTGHGDVLAIDMAAGLMKWKLCDCHPGGVSAVSFSRHNSLVYTAGVDSMVCQIDPSTGNLLSKFKASTKAISSLSISEDGKILCVASAQLKTFGCYDHKKIQRFPGHPVAVRCMIFSEDGKYILSSGVGEKCIAIWRVDASKKGSVCCALSIEHPAVFLDSKCSNAEDTEGAGLYVLAISEMGLCYLWYGRNIDDLRASKPTKISVCAQSFPSNNKVLAIFAAKIQGILKPGAESVLIAYGSLIKPSFEKVTVENGVDLNLEASQEGVLLKGQSYVFQTGQATQSKAIVLDRANAEDAILPLSKLYNHDNKRKISSQSLTSDVESEMDGLIVGKSKIFADQNEENLQDVEDVICLEDRLREIGILGNKKMPGIYISTRTGTTRGTALSNGVHLSFDANMPAKKIMSHILSMSPGDADKLLETLASMWKTRSVHPKLVLTWIYYILVSHGRFILSQDSSAPPLDALRKMARLKSTTLQPLLKLSGRLGLIMAQINKAGQNMVRAPSSDVHVDDDAASENEDIDELVYGEEEDGSHSGSDEDMN